MIFLLQYKIGIEKETGKADLHKCSFVQMSAGKIWQRN
jgi:hypothetical protein